MIRKLLKHQVYVDEIKESLKGQLLRKCGFGMLNEGDCEKILKCWENKYNFFTYILKDMKMKCNDVKKNTRHIISRNVKQENFS
jgi:hypothetical protein